MSIEQSKEALLEQLEALKKENEQLRKELSTLRDEKYNDRPVSFKEKYAVRILDSLPDMLTVFNQSEVGIEVVSNEETNHVGISNKDFRGMRMQDMVPPEAYQNIHSNMRHAITTGTVSTAHHELDFNGERHYYENRIFPLDEEYVLIMCRDITERVATQRQLEVFKSVLDKVSDSILAVAGDGTLVYANKQFIEEYGVTQELGTQKVYDLRVSMTDRGAWEKRLQEIRDNDGSFAYRAAYIPYGHTKERVHQVSAFLIRENNQELIWFFTQDITDVIKKRDELRELNLLLDGILNNIPVYLCVKDPEDDFRYLYWNKAFADHSGIPASKAIGHTDYEIFPVHGDAEKFRKDDLELLQTHKRIDMQETYLSANGEARIVQTLKALVPMEGRKPLLIGISWDITNLQNIEQELIRARIKAEQSDRLKSAFLANMSHEIRTPLNAIVGFAHLVTETTNASEQREYFSIINKNCDLLLKLINDILDLSKIESGRLNYNVSEVELRDICQEAYVVQSLKMTSDVALLYNSVAMPSVRLWIDPHRVEQVLLNLLSNAIKFTSKGFISLFYEVEDMFVRVSVMDTGIGISEEKLESVFERFVKLDDFYQGAGLGLPICKMIVEQLGGEIGVRSELGKGSTFWFTLPLVVTDKAVVEKDDPSVLSECQLY
jgi:two-component system sensor histidine kinase